VNAGIECDAEEARFAFREDVVERQRQLRCAAGDVNDTHAPVTFRHEQPAIGRERERPRYFEVGDDDFGAEADAVFGGEDPRRFRR
jgi:hypothetical protein